MKSLLLKTRKYRGVFFWSLTLLPYCSLFFGHSPIWGNWLERALERKKWHGTRSCHLINLPPRGILKPFKNVSPCRNSEALEKPETNRENGKNKTKRNNWLKPMTHNL